MNTILTGRILRKSNNWIRCFRLSWTTANGGSLPHKICQRQQPGFPQAAFLSKPNTCLNMSHLNFSTTGYQQNVQHDRENKRFFIEIQNVGTAYLEYDLDDKLIKLMHTTVPTALGGRGLGKILAKVRTSIHSSYIRMDVCDVR